MKSDDRRPNYAHYRAFRFDNCDVTVCDFSCIGTESTAIGHTVATTGTHMTSLATIRQSMRDEFHEPPARDLLRRELIAIGGVVSNSRVLTSCCAVCCIVWPCYYIARERHDWAYIELRNCGQGEWLVWSSDLADEGQKAWPKGTM